MSKSALDIWNGVVQQMSANSKQQEQHQKKTLRGLLPQYQREVRDRVRMPDATLLGQYAHHLQQSMSGMSPLTDEWGQFAEADRKEIMRRMQSASQHTTRATTMERTVGTTQTRPAARAPARHNRQRIRPVPEPAGRPRRAR